MTKLFGVDIAGVLNKALGPGLLVVKLVKVTPGTRDPADLAAGTEPTSKTYTAKGLVADFALSQFDGVTIQRGDRKVLYLGASLPSGVVPSIGDHAIAEGVESEIVAVQRDPASATYVCQVRGS
jgi:hypothetical protein